MPQLIRPAYKVKVIPSEGGIDITLNINITIDGKVVAGTDNDTVVEEEKPVHVLPDFLSGLKLNFGKTKEGKEKL